MNALPLFGIAALIGALIAITRTQGPTDVNALQPATTRRINRDFTRLDPSFRARLERMLAELNAEGFDAIMWEGYRTPERAKDMVARGVGKLESMHRLGLAADIISAKDRWNASLAFRNALHDAAARNGLTSGLAGDPWHVQALPWEYDARLFAMAADKRTEFVRTLRG